MRYLDLLSLTCARAEGAGGRDQPIGLAEQCSQLLEDLMEWQLPMTENVAARVRLVRIICAFWTCEEIDEAETLIAFVRGLIYGPATSSSVFEPWRISLASRPGRSDAEDVAVAPSDWD